ncbi:MAG: folate-binding protein [Alphaproteobacteria bacterium]|nr:folate-binding protein [Alphaproteobacteria bacterium]
MPSACLRNRSIIAITGEDRVAFLQGLITNEATLLAEGTPIYAALLSPQGKFLHDFLLVPHARQILLDVYSERAADLLARLNTYKLRAKVALELLPEMQVVAYWDVPAPAAEIVIADPRLGALGGRVYGNDLPHAGDDYEAHRIRLGIPEGAIDLHIDKTLPLEFGLDALHGLSFSKGCYVGQEVTARSKFRGQVRKQLYRVSASKPLPPLGTKVTTGILEIGELRSTSGHHGIAMLRTEEVEKTIEPLIAGNVEMDYHTPNWKRA